MIECLMGIQVFYLSSSANAIAMGARERSGSSVNAIVNEAEYIPLKNFETWYNSPRSIDVFNDTVFLSVLPGGSAEPR